MLLPGLLMQSVVGGVGRCFESTQIVKQWKLFIFRFFDSMILHQQSPTFAFFGVKSLLDMSRYIRLGLHSKNTVIFNHGSSSINGCPPSNAVFHQVS